VTPPCPRPAVTTPTTTNLQPTSARQHADEHTTLPTKPALGARIFSDGIICKINDGQQQGITTRHPGLFAH